MIESVVSGGQTGVDRAALDAALAAGMPCGGWCPRGRRAEDGPIPPQYPLTETRSANYIERTRRNVRDSDGTLVLCWGEPSGGSRATVDHARALKRPCMVINMEVRDDAIVAEILDWIAERNIAVLNIAGPRDSHGDGIYAGARALIAELLEESVRTGPRRRS